MKLSRFVTGLMAVAVVSFVVSDVVGQDQDQGRRGGGRGGAPGGFQGRGPGGPGGFGGRPGGGDTAMGLLRVEAVQTELEISPAQKEALDKMAEQAREAFTGGERPDFRNMSEADRTAFFEKMQKQREEQTAEMKAQLDEVLLPQQLERLDQIALQVRGVQALEDPEVAAKLKISEAQKKKLAEVRDGLQSKMREQMREMFQAGGGGAGGFDREAFAKLREDMEKEVLAVLDSSQQKQFEEMKGEKFEMPEGAMRGGFGGGPGGGFGGGGPGRGGPGGGPGGRPQRGGRPQAE